MKTCTKCKVEKPLTAFVKDSRRLHGVATYCKTCSFALIKAWRLRNPDKCRASSLKYAKANPGRHYRTKFGITHNDKLEMLSKQENRCAACGTTNHENPRFSKENNSGWIVDHDHRTGLIRGILCWRCNVSLGYVQDSVERLRGLASYLENNAAVNTLHAGLGTSLKEAVNGFN